MNSKSKKSHSVKTNNFLDDIIMYLFKQQQYNHHMLKNKKRKNIKGGDLPTDTNTNTNAQITASQIQQQANQYAQNLKNSLYGQYAIPFIKPSIMQSRGLPWYLAQHPNRFSANPNQVLLYRNSTQFINSDFYNKYKANMKLVPERRGYGQSIAPIIEGKPFRVVFRSMSSDDNNQYYLDLPDADSYMDLLDDAKESGKLMPTEFKAMQNIQNWAKEEAVKVKYSDMIWKKGYTTGQDELKPIIQQQQQEIENLRNQLNSSDSSFNFGDILSTGVGILSSIL